MLVSHIFHSLMPSLSGSTVKRCVEYPYVGIDFWGDPDLVLLAGEQWDVIGKKI